MEQINEIYPEKPWELKPCKLEDLEIKTRLRMGNEYWEKNKEDLIEKWKESVSIESKRIKLLRFLSEKDKVTLNEIYEAMDEKDKNEVLKILAVMKFQKLIEGIDNRLIMINDLGKEYLKNS